MVHGIDSCHSSATTNSCNRSSDLMVKKSGIGGDNDTGTLQKRFHFGRNVGGIDRGTEYDAVGIDHSAEYLRKTVFGKHTVTSTFAGETSPAWLNLIISQLYQLSLDTLFLQLIKYLADNDSRVAPHVCSFSLRYVLIKDFIAS